MSLTSHLNDTQSPIYGFMRERFPDTRSFIRAANKQMKEATTIRPEGQVDWGTIGTAIDYRLRYYFDVTPKESLVAWHGASIVQQGIIYGTRDEDPELLNEAFKDMETVKSMILEFFADLEGTLSRLRPERRRLDVNDEELIGRYCVGLALFEQVYRRGHIPERSVLMFPDPVGTASELLTRIPQAWVDDLCALSWAFYDEQRELLSRPTVLNPTFDGSRDVGGADADLIVDRCLLDIKTRVEPRLRGDDLYQLLGYILLDYSDRYGINEAGIYFSRQQKLVRWSLQDLIAALSDDSDVPLLRELRGQFQSLLPDS